MNFLVIINAPFHIVNALEALHYFKIEPKDCDLLVTYPTDNQLRSTVKFVEEYNWKSTTILKALSFTTDLKNLYPRYKEYKNYVKKGKNISFDKIFITQYVADDSRNIINQFQSKEVVLLDEGNAIFDVVDYRKAGVKAKSKRIKELLFGLNLSERPALTFFTEYDIKPLAVDKVIQSDNVWIKSQMNLIPKKDYTLFLGSAYVEDDFFSFEFYLQVLGKAFQQISNKVVYYPHRREAEQNLKKIEQTFDNLEIVRSTGPIELALKKFEFLPVQIAGFYTAAISKLKNIMGSELEAISFSFFHPPYFDEKNNPTIANITKDLSAKGVKCLELKETD